jgi:trigger factor
MALLEGCKHEIELEVPVAEIEAETERVVEDIRKKAQLPGFRPGKVPATLIKSRFASSIEQDVIEAVVPKAFRKYADANQLNVVGQPGVTGHIHLHKGEPLKFKVQFEVAPEFELEDNYRGVTVPYAEPQVSDEDIDGRLEALRLQRAEFVNEDPRPAAAGDHVLIALKSLNLEGEEAVDAQEVAVELGSEETLAGFNENIVGMSPGDTREFEVAYPDNYGSELFAGKTIRFDCTLKTIRRKELPELNDEFAQDLGDFKDLGELRDALKRSIYSERDHAARTAAHNALLDRLVEMYEFPLPDAFVDSQLESLVENRLRSIAEQGIDPRQLNLDWDKIRESQGDRARKDVKASLLLERIADREAIHATQEEVDNEVNRIARQQREAVASVRRKLEQDGSIGRIAGHIRTQKVLNFLFEQANKVAPEPEADKAEAAEAE